MKIFGRAKKNKTHKMMTKEILIEGVSQCEIKSVL